MENKVIKTDDLYFATIKYYEKDKGVEVVENFAYAFLIKMDNMYINPFSPLDLFPVFDRVPYPNYTLSGEEFGSKLRLLNTIDRSGPCFIVVGEKLFDKEEVNYEELEEYVINSKLFFKDRLPIAKERMKKFKSPLKMCEIILSDEKKLDNYESYFSERIGVQKVKK